MPKRHDLARWVSIVGHPYLLVPLAVALVTQRSLPPAESTRIIAVLVALMLVLLVVSARKVRSGAWNNMDVSRREQRPELLAVSLGLVATALAVFYVSGPTSAFVGTAHAAVLLVAAAGLNFKWKVSLHAAYTVFAALLLQPFGPAALIAGVAVALAVAWSRVELGRHTVAEVVLGASLGALTGLALLLR
jgi:membrane-associated phospholipid phosphatase